MIEDLLFLAAGYLGCYYRTQIAEWVGVLVAKVKARMAKK